MISTPPLFMGLDVGTGSARAGIFDATGRLLQVATRPIQVYRVEGHPLLYQQSSEGIWRALCTAVKEALDGLGKEPGQEGQVAALSVTATCSMVVMREAGMRPVDVTPPGATVVRSQPGDVDVSNVIMWLDHRARAEAEMITGTGHPMLRHVGGKVSPENEVGGFGGLGLVLVLVELLIGSSRPKD